MAFSPRKHALLGLTPTVAALCVATLGIICPDTAIVAEILTDVSGISKAPSIVAASTCVSVSGEPGENTVADGAGDMTLTSAAQPSTIVGKSDG